MLPKSLGQSSKAVYKARAGQIQFTNWIKFELIQILETRWFELNWIENALKTHEFELNWIECIGELNWIKCFYNWSQFIHEPYWLFQLWKQKPQRALEIWVQLEIEP